MENESFNQWQGALNRSFDEEIHEKSELAWEKVEAILLKEKRKRRMLIWFFTIGVVAFTLGTVLYFQDSLTRDNYQKDRTKSIDNVKHLDLKHGIGEMIGSNLSEKKTSQSQRDEIIGLGSETKTMDRCIIQCEDLKAAVVSEDKMITQLDKLDDYVDSISGKGDSLKQWENLMLPTLAIHPKDWTALTQIPRFLNYSNQFKF
ncbi:MAG: hypothetical protein FJX95_10025, partial [Bacteroidetes bacterium]|nr:hypothetical protein [Bacteroidota bacterium]